MPRTPRPRRYTMTRTLLGVLVLVAVYMVGSRVQVGAEPAEGGRPRGGPVFDNSTPPPASIRWGVPDDGRVYRRHVVTLAGDTVYARDERGYDATVPGGWSWWLLTAGGAWVDLREAARELAGNHAVDMVRLGPVHAGGVWIEMEVAEPLVRDDGSLGWWIADGNTIIWAETQVVRLPVPRPFDPDITGPAGEGVRDRVVNLFDLDYYIRAWLDAQGGR